MKYRVRVDFSFDEESDAKNLMDYTRGLQAKAVSLNKGSDSAVISYLEMEQCRHDEGLPCTLMERIEIG